MQTPDIQSLSQISRRQAKVLVCLVGVLVAAMDFSVPGDINIAIFYCLAIALCVWTRSLAWLWSATFLFSGLTFAGFGMAPLPIETHSPWVHWTNRAMTVGALLLIAIFIHLRIRMLERLERNIADRKRSETALRQSEARLRLAQTAANIASWEWNPVDRAYNWSGESADIFGVDPSESGFEKWLARVDPEDVIMVEAGIQHCIKQGAMELEFRFRHPSLGLRWIYSKARMLESDLGIPRMFGISQDITKRKEADEILLQSHATLESLVEERTSTLRRLSSRLLHAQDEERRRISRELHDSIGQCLTALKLNVEIVRHTALDAASKKVLAESSALLDEALVETRTISHLLHPPLLDEIGFASAARWYADGFAKRSSVKVNLEIPAEFVRLHESIELCLFRVLQESLTNVHRHSGSPAVDVRLNLDAKRVILEVRDYGRGMSPELLRRFKETGMGVGIGLTGMRERISELGGCLEISAVDHGTVVTVSMPLSRREDAIVHSARPGEAARSTPAA